MTVSALAMGSTPVRDMKRYNGDLLRQLPMSDGKAVGQADGATSCISYLQTRITALLAIRHVVTNFKIFVFPVR